MTTYDVFNRSGEGAWRTSSFSDNGSQCVEVRVDADRVSIRDTKDRRTAEHRSTITVTVEQWAALLAELTGHAAVGVNGGVTTEAAADGSTRLRCRVTGVTLTYTVGEWAAFLAGVRAGEFAQLAVASLSG